MNDYILFTDSSCDLSASVLTEWGVRSCALSFMFEHEDAIYLDGDMPASVFYDHMRRGKRVKTAAVNSETFRTAFEEEVAAGNDILYLGFSSGLSSTCHAAQIAAGEVMDAYPDRRVVVVDTLSASAGQALLLRLAVNKKAAGATLEENAAYVESMRLKICHWFTVDDLIYLRRGGRISAVSALAGNALNIRPVLHMDNDGHLANVSRVRGRKASLAALVNQYGELADDPSHGLLFLCHSDCMDDVEKLRLAFAEKYGVSVDLVTDVGPVIGAHSGPGTISVFFVGKER